MNLPEICTTEEVAAFLRVKPRDVKTAVDEGRLQGMKISPRKYRFRREKVFEFMEGACQDKTRGCKPNEGLTQENGRLGNMSGECGKDVQAAMAALKMQTTNDTGLKGKPAQVSYLRHTKE